MCVCVCVCVGECVVCVCVCEVCVCVGGVTYIPTSQSMLLVMGELSSSVNTSHECKRVSPSRKWSPHPYPLYKRLIQCLYVTNAHVISSSGPNL